jgi:hypothetical protein
MPSLFDKFRAAGQSAAGKLRNLTSIVQKDNFDMAEKVTTDPDKPKKGRKEKRERGMGDNIIEVRRKAEPLMQKLLALQKDMDSDMGGYKADFKKLYEDGANDIGCSRKTLRKEFRRLLAAMRAEEEEMQLEQDERDEIETLRAAFAGTEFERYIEGKLAKPPRTPK